MTIRGQGTARMGCQPRVGAPGLQSVVERASWATAGFPQHSSVPEGDADGWTSATSLLEGWDERTDTSERCDCRAGGGDVDARCACARGGQPGHGSPVRAPSRLERGCHSPARPPRNPRRRDRARVREDRGRGASPRRPRPAHLDARRGLSGARSRVRRTSRRRRRCWRTRRRCGSRTTSPSTRRRPGCPLPS